MDMITYAVQLTEENVLHVREIVAQKGLNVDYLRTDLQDATEDGVELYAILSLNYSLKHATFTLKESDDFKDSWYFCNGFTHRNIFRQVRLIKERP